MGRACSWLTLGAPLFGAGNYVGDDDLHDFPFIAALGLSSYLDIGAIPQPPGSILPLFAALGMVDTQLRRKPALAVWDSVYARRRQ